MLLFRRARGKSPLNVAGRKSLGDVRLSGLMPRARSSSRSRPMRSRNIEAGRLRSPSIR